MEIHWSELAVCRSVDPELFFPLKGDNPATQRAKRICASCPVAVECLEYGLDMAYGIYGGTTGTERRRIRTQRERQAA
jgi:WhiB family redox-sensing transcriptional regulator